jgi:hypothetical protein
VFAAGTTARAQFGELTDEVFRQPGTDFVAEHLTQR